jgi:hypothetical protein
MRFSRATFQPLDLNVRWGFFAVDCSRSETEGMLGWVKSNHQAKTPFSIKELDTFVDYTT